MTAIIQKKLLLLAGPTASGKTELAVRLAKNLNGEIINADAMQVYADLSILTARPTEAEMQTIPHHLYGFVSPEEVFSVGRWLDAAAQVMKEVEKRGRLPIFVGGTGLYFLTLLEGLAQIPAIDPAVEKTISDSCSDDGPNLLWNELESVDATTAHKLHPNDKRRIIRALAVFRSTGRPLSEWQAGTNPPFPHHVFHAFTLMPNREKLYAQIDQRFHRMVDAGVVEEVKQLYAKKIPPRATIRTAHGLPHLLSWLDGEIALPRAIELAKRDTRNYAKRQFTFLRGRLKRMQPVTSNLLRTRLVRILAEFPQAMDPKH